MFIFDEEKMKNVDVVVDKEEMSLLFVVDFVECVVCDVKVCKVKEVKIC